jgi:hypothetical protein
MSSFKTTLLPLMRSHKSMTAAGLVALVAVAAVLIAVFAFRSSPSSPQAKSAASSVSSTQKGTANDVSAAVIRKVTGAKATAQDAAAAIPEMFRQDPIREYDNVVQYRWRNVKCVPLNDPAGPGVGQSFQCQGLLKGTEPSFGQAVYHVKLGLMPNGYFEAFDVRKTNVKAAAFQIPSADENNGPQKCTAANTAKPVPGILSKHFHPKTVQNTC